MIRVIRVVAVTINLRLIGIRALDDPKLFQPPRQDKKSATISKKIGILIMCILSLQREKHSALDVNLNFSLLLCLCYVMLCYS